MLFQMVRFALPISHERAAHFFARRNRVTPERNFERRTGLSPSCGQATAISRNVLEVSPAAKKHLERCTGRITELSESLTPLSRTAQDIGKKKSPAGWSTWPGFMTNFNFDQFARRSA
jgi:hypothetical protein